MYEETHTKNVGDNIVDAHSIPTTWPSANISTLSSIMLIMLLGHLSGNIVVKYGHQKDTYYDEIGLCAPNKDTIMIIVVNAMGKPCVVIIAQEKEESSL